MRQEDRSRISAFVNRALAGEDVDFAEVQNIILESESDKDREKIGIFWNELMMFVNDYDIRAREPVYAERKRRRLIEVKADLVALGLLED